MALAISDSVGEELKLISIHFSPLDSTTQLHLCPYWHAHHPELLAIHMDGMGWLAGTELSPLYERG